MVSLAQTHVISASDLAAAIAGVFSSPGQLHSALEALLAERPHVTIQSLDRVLCVQRAAHVSRQILVFTIHRVSGAYSNEHVVTPDFVRKQDLLGGTLADAMAGRLVKPRAATPVEALTSVQSLLMTWTVAHPGVWATHSPVRNEQSRR